MENGKVKGLLLEPGLIRAAELSVPCPHCEYEFDVLFVAIKPGETVIKCIECGREFTFELVPFSDTERRSDDG